MKADLDIGGTEINFDPLLRMIRYWRRHCTDLKYLCCDHQ